MKKYFSLLSKNKFIFDVSKIASGTLAGQAAIFLTSIVLTRFYSPDDFGILGSFQSIVGVLWILATLRYDLALPIISERKERLFVGLGSIISSVGFCVLVGLFFFIIVNYTQLNFKGFSNLLPYYWLVPLGILILALFYIFNFFLISEKKYAVVSIAKAFQGIGMSGVQLAFAFTWTSGVALIFGYIFGYLLALFVLVKNALKGNGLADLNTNGVMSKVSFYLKKNIKFPFFSMPSSFANIASFQIPTLLIATIYSPELAGFFFLAQRILGMPIDLVTNSISQVFLGDSSSLLKSDPHKLKYLFFKILKIMALLGIVPILVLFFWGESFFSLLFGADWSFTGKMASVLTIMYYVRMVTNPLSQTLNILQKLNVQLFWDFLRLGLIVVLFFIAWKYEMSILNFVLSFSVLMAAAYVLHGILSYYYLEQRLREVDIASQKL